MFCTRLHILYTYHSLQVQQVYQGTANRSIVEAVKSQECTPLTPDVANPFKCIVICTLMNNTLSSRGEEMDLRISTEIGENMLKALETLRVNSG